MKTALRMAERGLLPDSAIRLGIHKLLRHRLLQIDPGDCQSQEQAKAAFIEQMKASPIALHTREANDQHYELPPAFFQQVLGEHLIVDAHWRVDGTHYARTARHWLANMDNKRGEILPIMAEQYGKEQSRLWFQRWRIFFMACEELFGYAHGQEWWVTHYRFCKRPQNGRSSD